MLRRTCEDFNSVGAMIDTLAELSYMHAWGACLSVRVALLWRSMSVESIRGDTRFSVRTQVYHPEDVFIFPWSLSTPLRALQTALGTESCGDD
jgi:hypothetical protein